MAWLPPLLQLFNNLKDVVTTSLVLARFDPLKPKVRKTNWSTASMGYILVQPGDDKLSFSATKKILKTGECNFDPTLDRQRLRPMSFGSRSCTVVEENFIPLSEKPLAGHWAISKIRWYLSGTHFFWVCDCISLKKIIDYGRTITVVLRWEQELLGYNFSNIHCTYKMMKEVDALSMQHGKSLVLHFCIAQILHCYKNNKKTYGIQQPIIPRTQNRL